MTTCPYPSPWPGLWSGQTSSVTVSWWSPVAAGRLSTPGTASTKSGSWCSRRPARRPAASTQTASGWRRGSTTTTAGGVHQPGGQPRSGLLVDAEPQPALRDWVRLLGRRGDIQSDGGRHNPASRRPPRWGRDLRDRPARLVSPVRENASTGPQGGNEAHLPHNAARWDQSGRQRRPSLAYASWLEVRSRDPARRSTQASPDDERPPSPRRPALPATDGPP